MEPVIRGRFDPQKLADLATREGDIRSQLNECTTKIHDLAAKAQGTSGLTDPEKDTYHPGFTRDRVVLDPSRRVPSYVDTDLTPGETVVYRVRKQAKGETGPWSPTIEVTVPMDTGTPTTAIAPSAPRLFSFFLTDYPTSDELNYQFFQKITLRWGAPSDGTTPFTYSIESAANAGFTSDAEVVKSGLSAVTFDVKQARDTRRFYRARADNAAGYGPYSPSVSVSTVANQPVPSNAPDDSGIPAPEPGTRTRGLFPRSSSPFNQETSREDREHDATRTCSGAPGCWRRRTQASGYRRQRRAGPGEHAPDAGRNGRHGPAGDARRRRLRDRRRRLFRQDDGPGAPRVQ